MLTASLLAATALGASGILAPPPATLLTPSPQLVSEVCRAVGQGFIVNIDEEVAARKVALSAQAQQSRPSDRDVSPPLGGCTAIWA